MASVMRDAVECRGRIPRVPRSWLQMQMELELAEKQLAEAHEEQQQQRASSAPADSGAPDACAAAVAEGATELAGKLQEAEARVAEMQEKVIGVLQARVGLHPFGWTLKARLFG